MSNQDRYKRQIVLPEIGEEGQDKISGASILVVGSGGLGCPALLYLAAAGVGHIGIIDFDKVDESNLQRQILFNLNDVGTNKAKAAAKHLSALNPDIKITAIEEELSDKNVESLFDIFDIIIDGTDNFAAKFLINDAAVKLGKPFIYGSILGFDGQVAVFNAGTGAPCYRCLFPAPPSGHIPNCAEAGVIGAVAGIIGTTQAMEAIKLIVNHASFEPLIGKLWTIDMRSMENRVLSLGKDDNCPVCNKESHDIMLEYTQQSCSIVPDITPEESKVNSTALLIDVREQEEWDLGYIKGAELIALSWLIDGNIPNIDKDRELIIYCRSGKRSKIAGRMLIMAGFSDVKNMSDGYEKWLKV